MTVAHALRVLWHEFPAELHSAILKQYAWFALYVYVAQLRRPVDSASITDYDLQGRDWAWVEKTALAHGAALDAHFFKVVCAPRAFRATFGDKEGFYLKAVVKFVSEFSEWTGFGAGLPEGGPQDR